MCIANVVCVYRHVVGTLLVLPRLLRLVLRSTGAFFPLFLWLNFGYKPTFWVLKCSAFSPKFLTYWSWWCFGQGSLQVFGLKECKEHTLFAWVSYLLELKVFWQRVLACFWVEGVQGAYHTWGGLLWLSPCWSLLWALPIELISRDRVWLFPPFGVFFSFFLRGHFENFWKCWGFCSPTRPSSHCPQLVRKSKPFLKNEGS